MAANANIIGIATAGNIALDKWKNLTDPVAFANATAEAIALNTTVDPTAALVNVTNIFGYATKTNATVKPTDNQNFTQITSGIKSNNPFELGIEYQSKMCGRIACSSVGVIVGVLVGFFLLCIIVVCLFLRNRRLKKEKAS